MYYDKQKDCTILLIVALFVAFVILLILQAVYIFLRVANYTLENLSVLISTIYQVVCSVYSLNQYLAVILEPQRVLKTRWEHIFDQELWQGILLEKVTQIRAPGR